MKNVAHNKSTIFIGVGFKECSEMSSAFHSKLGYLNKEEPFLKPLCFLHEYFRMAPYLTETWENK